jgi:hypothetical protein
MAALITASLNKEPFITKKFLLSVVHIINKDVYLMNLNINSFLNNESDLVGNAAYSGRDISTVSHFDMQVDYQTALIVGAYHDTSGSEYPAFSYRRNGGAKSVSIADISDTEAVADSMADDLVEVFFSYRDLADVIFNSYHKAHSFVSEIA